MVFQQDNARPHSARVTQGFLQQNGVRVMQWPAVSPDLNCIEHLWDVLGRHVQRQAPHNQQLRDALQRTWNAIPMETIQHLVRSMPNRLQECARAMGGHTRY